MALEATAVAVFAIFGVVGVRVPLSQVGYLLHGLWDTVHEFNAHAGGSVLGPRQTTSVPLAYGFFCATYDFLIASIFLHSPGSLARSVETQYAVTIRIRPVEVLKRTSNGRCPSKRDLGFQSALIVSDCEAKVTRGLPWRSVHFFSTAHFNNRLSDTVECSQPLPQRT